MKLYVKIWCPWCIEAMGWLKSKNYLFEVVDVLANPDAYQHMRKISGQSKTPTLELTTGEVLPDFDVGQLEVFLRSHSVIP